MKTIKEMIEVMEAYNNGARIEFSFKKCKAWELTEVPCWNWDAFNYRVQEEPIEEIEVFEWMFKIGNSTWVISDQLQTEEEAKPRYSYCSNEYKKTGRSFMVPKDEYDNRS